MDKHPLKVLSVGNGAKLIFTPCPGSKTVDLETSIAQLKQAGTSMLLTLMFDDEMARNNLSAIEQLCQQHQMIWRQLPIMDDAAPDAVFEQRWQQNLATITEVIAQQGTIAIHCKGGVGRTGLVAALILANFGWSTEQIIDNIQEISPKSLRIALQVDYFHAKRSKPTA